MSNNIVAQFNVVDKFPRLLWTPAEINTEAWYDASDSDTITESGGAVSEWRDKSGSLRHISQGTGSAQPTLGTDVVQFNGTTDYLRNSSPFMWDNGEADFYVVCKAQDTVFSRLIAEGNDSDENPIYTLFQVNGASDLGIYARDDAGAFVATVTLESGEVDNVQKLYMVRDDGSNCVARINGGSESIQREIDRTGHTLTLNNFTLGALKFDSNLRYIDADINEVVVTSNLSDADRQKIEGYLAWKWGIEDDLPVDHPYKNSTPTA
jgi:hypothetical protein